MSSNEKNSSGQDKSLNFVIGWALIAVGVLILLAEYNVFETPDFGWGLVMVIAGLAAIAAYYTTRPEPKAAELGSVLLCIGSFFLLSRFTTWLDFCDGFCWQGLLIAFGAGGFLALIITRGKSGDLTASAILVTLGVVFMLRERHLLGYGRNSWLIIGTIVLIVAGLTMIIKAFLNPDSDDEET
jgi:drug/metabolite transporter (DMT)-like permease